MKRLFLIASLGVIFLVGCSASQNAVITQQITQWNEDNMNQTIATAKIIMAHWDANSAALKVLIGPRLEEEDLYKLKRAVTALDGYVASKDSLTPVQSAEIVVWYGKFLDAAGNELYKSWMPKILAIAAPLGIK
jgi:hypothetical protein